MVDDMTDEGEDDMTKRLEPKESLLT